MCEVRISKVVLQSLGTFLALSKVDLTRAASLLSPLATGLILLKVH